MMAKFKNLLVISTDFTKIPNKFFEVFSKDYNEMIVLLRLMNTMETFNSWGRLKQDTSFYLSLTKMVEMFQGNISKPTLLKHLDNLEKKGFISKTKSNNPKQANFYIINCEKINKLCDTKTKEVFMEDEIPQELAEETPVAEKNSEPESADNKEKSTELAIVEKSPSNQEYCERIKIAWNAIASRYETTPSIAVVTETRLKHFKNILKYYKIDEKQFFNSVNKALSESKFLRGIGKKWRADFDFFINKSSYLKAIEGAYRDNPNEIMEILQDPAKMSFKEAQELREKIKIKELEEKYKQEETEEQLVLP
jgi:DNA-binding HxlR family transcriptional regulator